MIIVILFVLGLCLGSFTNALVWRIREQGKPAKKRKASSKELSITKGRSMCTHCAHTLAWYDLLPLVSWLSLGGKCRYCHKPIGWQYPLVEFATGLLFVASYIYWPVAFDTVQIVLFGLWTLIMVGFMALTVYDIRWMELPDRIVFPLQALAGLFALITLTNSIEYGQDILMLVLALVFSAGLFYGLHTVSDGRWIGGGDVKLGVVLGLLLATPAMVFLMLFIASLLGTLIALPLIIRGKASAKTRISFGPLLIVATVIVYLFGASMSAWYQAHILLV